MNSMTTNCGLPHTHPEHGTGNSTPWCDGVLWSPVQEGIVVIG